MKISKNIIQTLLLYGAKDKRVTRKEIDEIYLTNNSEEWKSVVGEFIK